MKSLSSVGLGLSIVFCCLLLALFAELYYLLWWKKRFANKDDYSSPARELFFMNSQELCSSVRITDALVHHEQESQLNSNTGKDILLRPWSDDSVEADLMRLHSLSGPPRFLFTIVEETKEDLESEDGRSRGDHKSAKGSRSRSLSDLLRTVETPYLTPLSSPPFFTPPLTPSYNQIGFNHLFESSKDAEFNKIRSSPPPKFKFLQDADEKLHRRKLMQETEEKVKRNDDDGPFITIIIDRNKEREQLDEQNHQLSDYQSSTSQVLPLATSPSTSKSAAKKSSFC
ncbi:transmembrane protein [Salix suchowensis]|nr:transmembrane protein [Salix suchowensis]